MFLTLIVIIILQENINAYLAACRAIGLSEADMFRTDELFEERNLTIVVQNMLNFARLAKTVKTFPGPYFE